MASFSNGVSPSGFDCLFPTYVTTSVAGAVPSASAQYVADEVRDAVKLLTAGESDLAVVNSPLTSHARQPGGLIFQFLGVGAANKEISARIEGWTIYGKGTLTPGTAVVEANQVLLVPTLYWSGALALSANVLRAGVRFCDDIVVAPAPVAYADGSPIGNDDQDPVVWDAASATDFATVYAKDAFFYFDFFTVKLNVITGAGGAATSASCLVRKVQ